MSEKYDEYLKEHKDNVYKAFLWLKENLKDELFSDEKFLSECEYQCQFKHDESKSLEDEYKPYDAYFYGGNKSYAVCREFDKAWLLHIHRNPHHWQYWILTKDDPNEGEIILDMDPVYIIEMICDWWSFSFKKGDLYEIFNWYAEHNEHMKLSEDTKNRVYTILTLIRSKLDTLKEAGEYADRETMLPAAE